MGSVNFLPALRFAPAVALLASVAAVASVACGSGQDQTTFIIYGEGAGPGSFTVTGGATASGAYGSCHASGVGDVFNGTTTTRLSITCAAGDISPKLEIDIDLSTTYPPALGTYDEAMTVAGGGSMTLHESDGGVAAASTVRSLSLTIASVDQGASSQTVTGSIDAVFVLGGIATPVTVQASF